AGSPPEARGQFVQHWWILQRTPQLVQPRPQNQRPIHGQRDPHEKPDRNRGLFFHRITARPIAKIFTTATLRQKSPYQKIMFSATNTIPTSVAQNAGRCQIETCASCGISVAPYTNPFNSLSGFDCVIRLPPTVTITQISHDHSARYISAAIGFALLESATYFTASGTFPPHRTIPPAATVPDSNPQKPPAAVVRFHNIPRITVPNSGAMKMLKSACT